MRLVTVRLVLEVYQSLLQLVRVELYALRPQLLLYLLQAGHLLLQDLLLADGSCLLAAEAQLAVGKGSLELGVLVARPSF